MSYAVFGDVFKRYNPILTMVGTAQQDVATLDISSVYCYDAESLVNAYIAKRYVVPVTTEPLVTMITADIAIYKILEDRAPRIPEFAQRRYDNAIRLLEQLRDGEMTLTASGTTANSGGDQEAWSNVLSYAPVFHTAEEIAASFDCGSRNNFGLL